MYLPEDNPANFSYFFDTSGRRTCYLAPERFLGKDDETPEYSSVTDAMDVFSVGCVIAELFLESPVFTLSTLFRYRGGETTFVKKHLEKIGDPDLEEMIMHMISIDPAARYTADDYLTFW